MFVPYSIVNPLTIIRVARRLPHAGEVLYRSGDTVEPAHIVAQTLNPPDFRIIDIARLLDIPVKRAKSCIKVERGDTVTEGDIVAARGGLGGRVCRAPISGTISGKGKGRLLLEADPEAVKLSALVPGMVIETWATEGVLIETVGAFIHAAWGNGQEAFGELRIVVRAPRQPIRPKHIDAAAQGAILVGGSRVDEETLERAMEMQVRGIIVGGVPPELLPHLKTLNFPVVATEGIGEIPMSKAVFDLLRSLDGRETSLSGRQKLRWGAERPYIVVPMPTQSGDPIVPDAPITVGSRVRVLRSPNFSVTGVVTDIPKGLQQLETGMRLAGVHVDLGGKETVFVPYPNLERLL